MNTQRILKVTRNMSARGLSQIIVTNPASVFYLTGVWCEPFEWMLALLVKGDGRLTLFGNRLFALEGQTDVPLSLYDDADDPVALLAAEVDAGPIGIDNTWPSHFTIRLMQARRDVTPVLGSQPVDDGRLIKDEEELALMRASSKMNVEVCRRIGEALHEGCTEKEIQALYNQIALELGASGPAFTPLICFGANGAEPHHDSDGTRLKAGDTVIMDVGLIWKRYCSDMTRTVHFGAPTELQKRVHAIVTAANRAGIAACRPGVKLTRASPPAGPA